MKNSEGGFGQHSEKSFKPTNPIQLKKILVVSDTHKKLIDFKKLLQIYENEITDVIHLGDNCTDADDFIDLYENLNFHVVKGNCDYTQRCSDFKLATFEYAKIFMTHGHEYDVKFGLNTLCYEGLERNANIILFGHTHSSLLEKVNDVIMMNPGSLSYPRGVVERTYAVIQIDDDGVNCKIYDFSLGNSRVLKELSV